MVNCNPETVSTDYDTSDRLYFEPLIDEYVFNIIKREKSKGNVKGVITQFGGQTPIKLAKFLHENKLPILGTQYSSIDLAEDRDRFRNLLNKLKLKILSFGKLIIESKYAILSFNGSKIKLLFISFNAINL